MIDLFAVLHRLAAFTLVSAIAAGVLTRSCWENDISAL